LFQKREILFFISVYIFFASIIILGEIRLNNATTNIHDSKIYRVVQPNINQKDKLDIKKIKKNFKKI